ncbi:MAG TPA: prephenate dehydrogenase/arogenate dehydrogenase family protein, partial [Clostridiales bacterium]|nr:prephenate dehydrogenase/arogenate dehydrogenase family protein [Clostridiales bacterium]
MNVGVVGLGLIGGSIAKAIKGRTDHKVLGFDIVDTVVYKARLINAIDAKLTDENLGDCDL